MIQEILQVQYVLQPWLRIMNKFATRVEQNEQICKKEAPPPHVEPPHMWSIHLCVSSTCGGSCVKCKFVQRWLRKMQICATILQIYSNLQGAEVVPPPKEVVVL